MTAPGAPRLVWKDVLMLACSVVGAVTIINSQIKGSGERDGRVAENTRRIEALERAAPDQQTKLTAILERTARIETKLEMIAPVKGQRP